MSAKRPKQKTPKALADRLRHAEAIRLRLAGKTYEEIARLLKYQGKGAACNAVERGLADQFKEPAEQLRTIMGARIESLLAAHWPAALTPALTLQAEDRPAVFRSLEAIHRLLERQARLYGLDQPVKAEVSGPAGGPIDFRALMELSDDQFEQVVTRFDKILAGHEKPT